MEVSIPTEGNDIENTDNITRNISSFTRQKMGDQRRYNISECERKGGKTAAEMFLVLVLCLQMVFLACEMAT